MLTNISVTSNQDYNQEYLAGDELRDVMLVQREYYLPISAISISSFINDDSYTQLDGSDLLLTFAVAPDTDKIHTLTIKVTTSDGSVYSEEIIGLKISK